MSTLRRIGVVIMILLGGLTAAGVTDAVNPVSAGAQSILPCPNGNNGWFDTWNPNGQHAAVNCSIQGNHIVADMHYGGNWSQGVLDIWYPSYCYPVFQPTASGNSFTIRFLPTNQLAGKCWSNYTATMRFYEAPLPAEYVAGEFFSAPQWMGLNTLTFFRAYGINWNTPGYSIDSPAGFINLYERGYAGIGGVPTAGKWSHYWHSNAPWDAQTRISIWRV